MISIIDCGAIGDNIHNDTPCIQKAVDKCALAGGGTVVIPSGTYRCGTIVLKDYITILFENGSTISFSSEEDDFADGESFSYNPHADMETSIFQFALFYAENCENISIIGPGMIDGNPYPRGGPKPISLKCCENITIRDIIIRNAPNYAISMIDCEYVTIDNVQIQDAKADGIDPDSCRFVRISNCLVDSADDAICIKTSPALGKTIASSNIVITNCILSTSCNAFKIGTETSGDVRNITVSNCTIRPKAFSRRASSGIAIESADGAKIENITVSNIAMNQLYCPIFICLVNRGRAQQTPTPGIINNVIISNVVCTNAKNPIMITGIQKQYVKNIKLHNIIVQNDTIKPEQLEAFGQGLNVPEADASYPDPDIFGDLPIAAVFCRYVEGLSINELHYTLAKKDPRPFISFNHCENIKLKEWTLKRIGYSPNESKKENFLAGYIENIQNFQLSNVRFETYEQQYIIIKKENSNNYEIKNITILLKDEKDIQEVELKSQ
jgi:polygalacturonase